MQVSFMCRLATDSPLGPRRLRQSSKTSLSSPTHGGVGWDCGLCGSQSLAPSREVPARWASIRNEKNEGALAFYKRLGFRAERPRWQGGRQLWLNRPLEKA